MEQTKPSVLVLGTYHMGNRGDRDVYKFETGNVEGNKQQEEIREVVDCLKTYNPTKIAVEYETVRADILEEQYKKYITGMEEHLEVDEIHQIGFPLAKELNHHNIYPVDWNRPAGGVPLGFVYEFLKEADRDLYNQIIQDGEKGNKNEQELFETNSIREILSFMNSPKRLKVGQETYMKFALAAMDDFYLGIDWLANYWYRRNLIIFTNVKRLVSNANDRILVIYGAGHKYLLDQFFNESNQFTVHSVRDYL